MKAYKIELLVIDHENVGEEGIVEILENSEYVYPRVMDIKSTDIEWTDEHPLNKKSTIKEEFNRLFQ